MPQSIRSFGWMLLLSLLLHLGGAAYLSLAPRGIDGPTAPVLDVALSEPAPAAAPMTTPPLTTETTEEAEPEEVPAVPDNPVSQPATTAPPAPPAEIVAPPSSLLFGISSGSFASFGDGITLREDIRSYFLEILERINASWQKEGTGVKLTSQAMLLLSIERSGELHSVQMLRSSGNAVHDRLLANAVSKAAPFPPIPASFVGRTFETPLRFTPPLSLMSFGSLPAITSPH